MEEPDEENPAWEPALFLRSWIIFPRRCRAARVWISRLFFHNRRTVSSLPCSEARSRTCLATAACCSLGRVERGTAGTLSFCREPSRNRTGYSDFASSRTTEDGENFPRRREPGRSCLDASASAESARNRASRPGWNLCSPESVSCSLLPVARFTRCIPPRVKRTTSFSSICVVPSHGSAE